MRLLVHLLQIGVVVSVCALLGAKLAYLDLNSSEFSFAGAVTGGVLPLIAFAIFFAFRRGRPVTAKGSQSQIVIMKIATLAAFAAMLAFVGLIYTSASWLKPIFVTSTAVGAFSVFALLVTIISGRGDGA